MELKESYGKTEEIRNEWRGIEYKESYVRKGVNDSGCMVEEKKTGIYCQRQKDDLDGIPSLTPYTRGKVHP